MHFNSLNSMKYIQDNIYNYISNIHSKRMLTSHVSNTLSVGWFASSKMKGGKFELEKLLWIDLIFLYTNKKNNELELIKIWVRKSNFFQRIVNSHATYYVRYKS